ncbi:DUF6907 domain-containing protein [Streptomyces sp. NPDC050256]|uniref:DUF6907 domain-containing protein n=1 Tax=Streptomyces sp. NPDC050256 TaxID=3365607 RepID=UPI00379CF992
MTAPRTVTVPTLDQGDVTFAEPSWCAGHSTRPEYRCDIGHVGAAHLLTYSGTELGRAALAQNPFAESSDRSVRVVVSLGVDGLGLTPSELDDLAAALVDYAGTLRHLARLLGTLQGGEGR